MSDVAYILGNAQFHIEGNLSPFPTDIKKKHVWSICMIRAIAINTRHNTQRAWVVVYAAHARLAVYRTGLAWQNWKWSWVWAVRRRRPRKSTWVECAPEATHRRWPEKPSTTGGLCCVDGIGLPVAWQPAVSKNVSTPQFIEPGKVCTYHRVHVISREGREGKQTVQTSKPEKDAAKAVWGQACSIRHKMATDLAVRARDYGEWCG